MLLRPFPLSSRTPLYPPALHPPRTGPFGLKAEALETFVRSCAGSCVATYILGVGDRHLDNLMLARCGIVHSVDIILCECGLV